MLAECLLKHISIGKLLQYFLLVFVWLETGVIVEKVKKVGQTTIYPQKPSSCMFYKVNP